MKNTKFFKSNFISKLLCDLNKLSIVDGIT